MTEPKILFLQPTFLVALKPVGVPSEHDASGDADMTVLLSAELRAHGENDTVFPVHRLDRATGGVMVFARTREAAAALSAALRDRETEKIYFAVTEGIWEEKSGELVDYLYHDARRNRSFPVKKSGRAGVKEARLRYKVLAEQEDKSLLAVRLLTGRTHQVRVQTAARRHPLVGDGKYGSHDNRAETALYAVSLSFPNPESGEVLNFSALPENVYPWGLFYPLPDPKGIM